MIPFSMILEGISEALSDECCIVSPFPELFFASGLLSLLVVFLRFASCSGLFPALRFSPEICSVCSSSGAPLEDLEVDRRVLGIVPSQRWSPENETQLRFTLEALTRIELLVIFLTSLVVVLARNH